MIQYTTDRDKYPKSCILIVISHVTLHTYRVDISIIKSISMRPWMHFIPCHNHHPSPYKIIERSSSIVEQVLGLRTCMGSQSPLKRSLREYEFDLCYLWWWEQALGFMQSYNHLRTGTIPQEALAHLGNWGSQTRLASC